MISAKEEMIVVILWEMVVEISWEMKPEGTSQRKKKRESWNVFLNDRTRKFVCFNGKVHSYIYLHERLKEDYSYSYVLQTVRTITLFYAQRKCLLRISCFWARWITNRKLRTETEETMNGRIFYWFTQLHFYLQHKGVYVYN